MLSDEAVAALRLEVIEASLGGMLLSMQSALVLSILDELIALRAAKDPA